MCNACGFSCCAYDGFSGCGCDECDNPACWTKCDGCNMPEEFCECDNYDYDDDYDDEVSA
jgi:hypothetical protein